MITRREFIKRTGILVAGAYLASPLASIWGSESRKTQNIEFFITPFDYRNMTAIGIRDTKSNKRFGVVVNTLNPSREQISKVADLLIKRLNNHTSNRSWIRS